MFYRRKIVLALLELLEGKVEKIRLHKLLFLYSQRKPNGAEYDFIPYKFGSYSYSLHADLQAMEKHGLVFGSETEYTSAKSSGLYAQLTTSDQDILKAVVDAYGTMSNRQLMKHTYIDHPYYAIHSEAAEDLLTDPQMAAVRSAKPESSGTVLYTIGYEGISIEAYLNKLIRNNVKALVDVRNRPQSMKFGFSKNRMSAYCASVGIAYFHFPEVGIASEKRQQLEDQSDYDALFEHYRRNDLPKTVATQKTILELLKKHERIALTCFEADHGQCHRDPLAGSIASLPGFSYTVKHL
jgi:uncharacterized protein (DUF488 family)